eukprot:CAMPEP_0179874476 /NCGR_PEP_ID=MMETSP0982-20121206/22879_1 /TAXON_ID=483367 /ORGANISM="non described non described, Strain CCMP 2436" /LENGTH=70 /DNA_ID=CAMNT_0021766215 /DNA_START=10 /DNA_END=220 /DNA_ORIENTATION=-
MTPSRAMTFVKAINGTLKLSKLRTSSERSTSPPHHAAQRAEAAGAPQNHGAPLDKVKLPAIGKFASPGWF